MVNDLELGVGVHEVEDFEGDIAIASGRAVLEGKPKPVKKGKKK